MALPDSTSPPTSPPAGARAAPPSALALAAVVAALWVGAQLVVFGWLVPPGPESPAHWAILLALCLGLALAHTGCIALACGVASRLARRVPSPAADLALAIGLGGLYAALALSLVKFVATHAHLRLQDFWFLSASIDQVTGEGTTRERLWIATAVALPLALSCAFLAAARYGRRAGARFTGWRLPALLTAGGVLLLAVLQQALPPARWALVTLFPETVALSRWLEPGADAGGWRPEPDRHARIAAPSTVPAPRPWNVVVLMLESVPWKRLYGPERRAGSTPVLDRLATESIVFERAYATSTHSDYAQTSILASLSQRKSDQHDYFGDLAYPRALPWDVLAPHGWRSAVFSTQNERWGNMVSFLTTPALATLRHAPDFPDAPRRGAGAETKIFEATVVDAFLDWTGQERERPFVAYLNFQATHFPYVWPAELAPPYGPAPIDFPATFLAYPRDRIPRMLDRFHNALVAVDVATGALVDGLVAQGVWERTALLIVADHGEAFYEHGLPTHGTTLHEEQLRVPMLLRLPGAPPRVVREPVSVVDALPTLYRAMGMARHGNLQGRDDLLAADYTGRGRAIAFTIQGLTHEDGVLRDGWKWIVNHDRRDGALFDLERDPEERRNLLRAEPERRAALDRELAAILHRQLGYYAAKGWEAGWYPPRLP